MVELSENNLSKRQHELNTKVLEAFHNKINFDEIKRSLEKSDVDRLFKIDLASQYKNIDYIIETFKSGDSLYISRALKCTWIYNEEFKNVMNPEYLHQNIFSVMSTKMKKKTLAAIAKNITDSQRVKEFYEYCVNSTLDKVAFDFLPKSPDSVKSQFLNKHIPLDIDLKWEHFFGNSIELIESYLQKKKFAVNNVDKDLYKLRYLFSVSSETYLNILEKYTDPPSPYTYDHHHDKFGLRISKEIMVRYKSRVLEKPWLYLRKLNTKIVAKHSTSENAKIYIKSMLPDGVNNFWNLNYYHKYIDFFHLLPSNERYQFLKNIFNEKYPEDIFEMNILFYRSQLYELLTADERNNWALKHLEQKQELLEKDKDFLWYRFVKFDTAFKDIKSLIFTTTCHNKRAEMLEVLVKSASNLQDLEILLFYYLERHVNESFNHKEKFINEIITHHNIFEFNEKCWDTLYKLLHSLDFLSSGNYSNKYPMLAIVYNIIRNKKIPEILEPHCKFIGGSHLFTFLPKLNKEQQNDLYEFFMAFFINKIEVLSGRVGSTGEEIDCIKNDIIAHVHYVLTLMQDFQKSKTDCPEVVISFVKSHLNEFSYYKWFEKEMIEEAKLLRLLKKDKMLLIDKFNEIKENPAKYKHMKMNNLLRKLKVYFTNDSITTSVITFFEEWLNSQDSNKLYNQIVFALFQLADESNNINFMNKHAPLQAKIEHHTINKDLLKIQQAICSFAYYTRPPVPLENMLQYIKGDYVHFCLPMFNSYLVNLPLPSSLQFIQAMLNSPVSVSKHGIRLAFETYNPENLRQLIVDIWKKSKNVSLRLVIYKSLFGKIKKANEITQSTLYEVLKMITLELKEDDQDELFDLLVSASLPGKLNGDYLQAAWIAVRKLPDNSSTNVSRKTKVIEGINSYIEQIDREFCRTEIIDTHIHSQLLQKEILNLNSKYGVKEFNEAKWNLTAKYITHFDDNTQLNNSIQLLELVMRSCEAIWDKVCDKKYKIQVFLFSFVQILVDQTDYRKDMERKCYIVPIYEKIIEYFVSTHPLKQIYCIVLKLKLSILGRNSVGLGKFNNEKQAITYDHLSENEVSSNFAKGIVELLNDLIATGKFYYSFYSDLTNWITETIQVMVSWTNLDFDSLRISVCSSLAKINSKEAYILASHILPVEINNKKYRKGHSAVVRVLEEIDNDEVKTFTYHKFVLRNSTF